MAPHGMNPYSLLACHETDCPIKHHHPAGPLFFTTDEKRHADAFGSSNPPSEVWDAYDRLRMDPPMSHYSPEALSRDVKIVLNFDTYHVLNFERHNTSFKKP